MKKLSKIKQSKVAINTTLSTRKSESKNDELTIFNENLQEVSIEDLKKSSFTYGGAFPYLTNALSQLCTINPQFDNGDFVVKGQNDKESTHYSALLKWETLVELATDNDPLSKDMFRHEIMNVFRKPPELYVKLGNGYSVLTHPFIIRSIVYEDTTQMSKKDAEICARLGIKKKISHVDVEFFKPMFTACLQKNNHSGYVYLDPAFYAKEVHTIRQIQTTPTLAKVFERFYNPRTGEYVLKSAQTYYKYILYFLTHVSEKETDHTTINAIDMLRHVDPAQLYERNGKDYIKNKYDTKLFIDKAGTLYNTMAQLGYCENTFGVINGSNYNQNDDNYIVYFQKARPRTNIDTYTSNFIESEIINNEPIEIDYTKQVEGRNKDSENTTNKDYIAIQNGL